MGKTLEGKKRFNNLLTGLVNPLKGIIPYWDNPLSVCNGEAFICYRTEPVVEAKNTDKNLLNMDEASILASQLEEEESENTYQDSDVEEEIEEKKTPRINNRYVKIHYFFKGFDLSENRFDLDLLDFYQLSKEKFADANFDFSDDLMKVNLIDGEGREVLNKDFSIFSLRNFNINKKRYMKFLKLFDESKMVLPNYEMTTEDLENMSKKHCFFRYNEKSNRISLDGEAVFNITDKYQTRLDKNLFPRFSKNDKINICIKEVKRNIKENIPSSFIIRFIIKNKLYDAELFISSTCCL